MLNYSTNICFGVLEDCRTTSGCTFMRVLLHWKFQRRVPFGLVFKHCIAALDSTFSKI